MRVHGRQQRMHANPVLTVADAAGSTEYVVHTTANCLRAVCAGDCGESDAAAEPATNQMGELAGACGSRSANICPRLWFGEQPLFQLDGKVYGPR